MVKTLGKAALGAIGFVLGVIVSALPMGSPWKVLVLAILGLGTSYGIWQAPYIPAPSRVGENVSTPSERL